MSMQGEGGSVGLWQTLKNIAQMIGSLKEAITTLDDTLVTGFSTPYPDGATPATASSGNVANAVATATLAGTTGVTTYITGFDVTSAGATAASVVTLTVTGTISIDLAYTVVCVAGATTPNAPLSIRFPMAVPAINPNTAIAVSLPALGTGNTNATVVAYGYQL